MYKRQISNSALGVEIAAKARLWGKVDPEWELDILAQAAIVVSFWAVGLDIPTTYLYKQDVDRGLPGITTHGWNDPARRSDPGVSSTGWTTFPHERFMALVKDYAHLWDIGTHPKLEDSERYKALKKQIKEGKQVVKPKQVKQERDIAQQVLDSFLRRYSEGRAFRGSKQDIRLVQKLVKSAPDGYYGPNTQKSIDNYLKRR